MAQDGSASPEIPNGHTNESQSDILAPKNELARPAVEPVNVEERLTQIRRELNNYEPKKQDENPSDVQPTANILFTPSKTGLGKFLAIGEEIVSLPLRKATEFILLRSYKDFVSTDRIKKSVSKLTIVEAFDFLSRSYQYSWLDSKPQKAIQALSLTLAQSGVRRNKTQSVEVNGTMIEAPLALAILSPNPVFLGILGLGMAVALPVGMHETIHDMSASKDGNRLGLKVVDKIVDGKKRWENNNFNELAVIDSMADHVQSAFKIPAILLGRLPSLFYPGPLAVVQWERMRRSLDKKFGKAHTRHLIDLALFYDDGLTMLQSVVDEVRGIGSFQRLSDRSTTQGLIKGLWSDVVGKFKKPN